MGFYVTGPTTITKKCLCIENVLIEHVLPLASPPNRMTWVLRAGIYLNHVAQLKQKTRLGVDKVKPKGWFKYV